MTSVEVKYQGGKVIDKAMEKFTIRMKDCIETYGLEQTPFRMKEHDDVQSELIKFNYGNLHYYG